MKELMENYRKREREIRQRLNEFRNVKEEDYFYEMCFCILTPQTSARRGELAVNELKRNGFHARDIDAAKILKSIVRFHNTKARNLNELKANYGNVMERIRNAVSGNDLREWLVKNVKGYGYKEASHFLRNIGYRNLAILDRHILKNLHKYNVIKEVPKSLTRKRYIEIEERFIDFGKRINVCMDDLDLLFWSMETGEVFK